jgi:EsV-1-7 cysteine-rich motif
MVICCVADCKKESIYNLKGLEAKYCCLHKLENMTDVKTRKCAENGCSLRPTFNMTGEKKAIYCSEHKKDEMTNVVNKRCKHNGCLSLNPSFNFVTEKKGLYCSQHQQEGMVSVISKKRCLHENCDKLPSFNIRGRTVGIYCATHRTDEMINVVSQRCNHENCEKISPIYNFKGEVIGKFCLEHKHDGMINVVSPRCNHENCEKICPVFNYKNETPGKFCATHKLTGMVNVKTPRCQHENCETISTFNFSGQTVGKFCSIHKETNMIDVKHKRCKTHLCDTFAWNTNYDGYCMRCYVHTFPDKPVSRNYKTKERTVAETVLEKFPDISWNCDKKVQDGCSLRRPDIKGDMGSHVVIIEIDENHHSSYDCSCENRRIMEISRDVDHRPIVFIRFNPDGYTDIGMNKIASCWGMNISGIMAIKISKKKEWEGRIKVLHEQIQYWIENVPEKNIETIQLFY